MSKKIFSFFKMFFQATPFKQFHLVFSTYGFSLWKLSPGRKILAILLLASVLLQSLLSYGGLFQVGNDFSTIVMLAIQIPASLSRDIRIIYLFANFKKIEKFRLVINEMFNKAKNASEVTKTLKLVKRFALLFVSFMMMIVFLMAIGALVNKKAAMVFWKPPGFEDLYENFGFYPYWVLETVGVYFASIIFISIELMPICYMMMFAGYIKMMNEKFKSASTKSELLKCLELYTEVRSVVGEFRETFSTVLLVQALANVVTFCATLLLMTSPVSFSIFDIRF